MSVCVASDFVTFVYDIIIKLCFVELGSAKSHILSSLMLNVKYFVVFLNY